jgi:hypothetical protein
MKPLLDRLCERCGVLPAYRDIWGRVTTSDAAKRCAMGSADSVGDRRSLEG